MTYLLVLIGLFLNSNAAADPYDIVSKTVLDNGLAVYFAPGTRANTVTIQVEYGVGWEQENNKNMGVAHLLEHTLFRHDSLPPNMSFMEVVKEEGGTGNGYTMEQSTSYFTTIRSDKADWLLNWYAKLFIDRKIKFDDVNKGRKEVMLELGEKENQFDLFFKKVLSPVKMPSLGFWKTEFGIPDRDYDEDLIRDNTKDLTEKSVQAFYDDYYHPQNMRIFVAGDFDVAKFKIKIKNTFGKMEKSGKDGRISRAPVPRKRPYVVARIAKRDTYISLGTKVWNINATDEMIMRSYLNYLSHRLMKEIRNLTGETYTAMDEINLTQGYGYGLVSLQTTRDRYHSNLELVRNHIESEARRGGIADEQIEEAKRLYLKKFEIVDTDSMSLLGLARGIDQFGKDYKETRSPYQVLKQTSATEYRERLAKMFKSVQKYEEFYAPPILFRGDDYATNVLFAVLMFFIFKSVFIKKFDHTKVRYIRKIKYAPMTVFMIFTFVGLPLLFLNVASYAVRWIWDLMNLKAYLFTNSYLFMFIVWIGVAGTLISYLAFWPRKIMIVGDKLVIKSLTYYSYSIPLEKITMMKVYRVWRLRKYPSLRYRFIDLAFFRKGLYLETNKGFFNRFFFGFANADQVHRELKSVINSNSNLKKVA